VSDEVKDGGAGHDENSPVPEFVGHPQALTLYYIHVCVCGCVCRWEYC